MAAAAAEYSRRWLPHALAVVDLTQEGFGGNRRAYTLNLKLMQARRGALLALLGRAPVALLHLASRLLAHAAVLPGRAHAEPSALAPPPQLISQAILSKLTRGLLPPPAFMQLNSTTIPYAVCLARGRQELAIFKAALAAVVAAAAAAAWRAWGRAALAALGLA